MIRISIQTPKARYIAIRFSEAIPTPSILGNGKNIDIINIYAPQIDSITETELNKITNNLENNVVILRDFNSHNRLWEPHCNNDDKHSEEIIKFMTNKKPNTIKDIHVANMAW